MRLAILFEDLDDKDTFVRTNCMFCNEQYRAATGNRTFNLTDTTDSPIDMEEFHALHAAARQVAMAAGQYGTPEYKSAYEDVMNRHQYYYVPGEYGSHWIKEYIRESLDDKDTFEHAPEIDIDSYILEYWGMNAASDIMLSGAKEQGWVPKSPHRGEQFQDIKTQFPDLYAAAVEVAWNSIG